MREYSTEAVVLKKEPANDTDLRVSLFTEALGKIRAKVRSGRKIVSKLAPHLEPLNIVSVRLVEKGGLTVTDALKIGALPGENFEALGFLDEVLMPQSRDYRLWLAVKQNAPVRELLGLLGFDPSFAACSVCGAGYPDYFHSADLIYLCRNCVPGGASAPGGYIYVDYGGARYL